MLMGRWSSYPARQYNTMQKMCKDCGFFNAGAFEADLSEPDMYVLFTREARREEDGVRHARHHLQQGWNSCLHSCSPLVYGRNRRAPLSQFHVLASLRGLSPGIGIYHESRLASWTRSRGWQRASRNSAGSGQPPALPYGSFLNVLARVAEKLFPDTHREKGAVGSMQKLLMENLLVQAELHNKKRWGSLAPVWLLPCERGGEVTRI
jgi:hypothetical protein